MKNPNYFGQKYDLVATIPVCIGDYVHRQTFLGPGLMSKSSDIINNLKSDEQCGIDYKTEMLSNDSIAGGTYEHVTDGHGSLEITVSMEHDIVFTKKNSMFFDLKNSKDILLGRRL